MNARAPDMSTAKRSRLPTNIAEKDRAEQFHAIVISDHLPQPAWEISEKDVEDSSVFGRNDLSAILYGPPQHV